MTPADSRLISGTLPVAGNPPEVRGRSAVDAAGAAGAWIPASAGMTLGIVAPRIAGRAQGRVMNSSSASDLAVSVATTSASVSATMISPTSSATRANRPWRRMLAVWLRLSSVGVR